MTTIIYKKYCFDSKEYADDLIDQLGYAVEEGVKYPTYRHTVSNLGFLIKTPATYDDQGNELTPPVFYDKWSVDMLWRDLPTDDDGNPIFPDGWQEYLLTGLEHYQHGFLGWTYNE